MRKALLCLAVLLLLTCGASAAYAYNCPKDFTDKSLQQVWSDFMTHYDLSEQDFSVYYYNTVTEESYKFNDEWFTIAASTYKLPLNMYFYEMEQSGEITSDSQLPGTTMTIAEAHEQSVLYSNNEVSTKLLWYWGDFQIYKNNLLKYTTMPQESIPDLYYKGNFFCTRMMMDTLKYLYANRANFEELIGYMKEAMKGQYFQAKVPEYEIAHKYGEVDDSINDVAIIYTPQPILLAVYTKGVSRSVVEDAARLATNYAVWKTESQVLEEEQAALRDAAAQQKAEEEKAALRPDLQREPEEEPEDLPEEDRKLGKRKTFFWCGIGGLSAVLLIAVPIIINKKQL